MRRWIVSLFFAPLMRAARVLIVLGRFDAADRALRLAQRVSRLAAVLVVLALPALAQVPASQPFDLASQWAPWTGQVASICGPGKNCTVRSLRATVSTMDRPALCVVNPPGAPGTVTSVQHSSASQFGIFYGASCDSGAVTFLYGVNNSTGVVQLGGTGGNFFGVATAGFASGSAGTGTAFASFPTCNASAGGRLLYDSTNGFWRVCDGVNSWNVLDSAGRPPLFTQRTYLLDVGLDGAGAALSWNPAPRPGGAAASVTETCTSMSGSTLGTEPNRFDVKSYTTSAISGNVCSVLTTVGFKREKSPRWCVRATPQQLTSIRFFVGLSSALPGASDTAPTNNYAAFRYSTNVPDTVYQACSSDGTTASCTSTGVAPTNGTLQLLCVDMRESGAVSFSIDGVVVVRKTTNLPTSTTSMGGFWSSETLAASTRTFSATSAVLEIN